MGSQPTPISAGTRPGYATSLAPREWALLVRVPPRVLAAVLAVPFEPPPVSAGLAGLAIIASASTSRVNDLTREVAAAIFASVEAPDDFAPAHVVDEIARAECLAAGRVLAHRVPTADAAQYRHWVGRIGAAALASGVPDDPIGASQARLLDECERALAG
jgi:hypothetical protein